MFFFIRIYIIYVSKTDSRRLGPSGFERRTIKIAFGAVTTEPRATIRFQIELPQLMGSSHDNDEGAGAGLENDVPRTG